MLKTGLAREVVERFGWAWPGGIFAVSLESPPTREQFARDLARFLGIDVAALSDYSDVEQQVLARLSHRRTLVVLDSAETLVAAAEDGELEALRSSTVGGGAALAGIIAAAGLSARRATRDTRGSSAGA